MVIRETNKLPRRLPLQSNRRIHPPASSQCRSRSSFKRNCGKEELGSQRQRPQCLVKLVEAAVSGQLFVLIWFKDGGYDPMFGSSRVTIHHRRSFPQSHNRAEMLSTPQRQNSTATHHRRSVFSSVAAYSSDELQGRSIYSYGVHDNRLSSILNRYLQTRR